MSYTRHFLLDSYEYCARIRVIYSCVPSNVWKLIQFQIKIFVLLVKFLLLRTQSEGKIYSILIMPTQNYVWTTSRVKKNDVHHFHAQPWLRSAVTDNSRFTRHRRIDEQLSFTSWQFILHWGSFFVQSLPAMRECEYSKKA